MRKRPRVENRSLKEQESELLGQGVLYGDGYYYLNIDKIKYKRANLIWNIYNSNNKKVKNDGFVIHHKNEDKEDDNYENLERMAKGEHISLHHKGKDHFGKNNPMFNKNHSKKSKELISINHANFKGENHPKCRISKKEVLDIRKLWDTKNYSVKELVTIFNYTKNMISKIVHKRTWQHLL